MKTHIQSITDANHTQHHYVLNPALPIEKGQGIKPTSPLDPELLSQHQTIYQDQLNIPSWQEVIWATQSPLENLELQHLPLVYSTSFEAQAIRQGLKTSVKTLGLVGLIETSDHRFVLGLRTGNAMGGYLCNAPAGHCAPDQPGTGVISAGFIEELETELGVTTDEVGAPLILGYQSDPDFGKGVNLVIYAKTPLNLAELQSRYSKAYELAQQAKAQGANYNQVKQAISKAGLINIDAHEHDLLIGICSEEQSLKRTIDTRTASLSDGTKAPVMDIARGSLLIYLESKRLKALPG